MDEFHYAVARVSTAQICRASGIERSKASVLDILTDILIKYLNLLGQTATKSAMLRGSDVVDISDAVMAAVKCGAVTHGSSISGESVDDIVEFLRWLRGPSQARMVHTAVPQLHVGSHFSSAQGAALAALPSSTAAAAAAAATTDPKSGTSGTLRPNENIPGMLTPIELREARSDWLRNAVNKQILIGHTDWFVNTEFGPYKEPDPVIHGDA